MLFQAATMPDLIRCLSKAALFICCFSVAFAFNTSPAFAQGTSTWQRYNPQDEEFSVLLPEEPLSIPMTRPKLDKDLQPIMGRLYSAYTDGTVFLIMSLDNPKNKDSIQTFIEEFKEYPAGPKEATFDKDIKVGGFKGKQYRLQSKSGVTALKGVAQFFTAKERAFVFLVVGEEIDKPIVNQFLSSIRLDKQGKAQAEDVPNKPTVVTPQPQPAASTEDENKVFTTKEVTRKAVIVSRPPPQYTEAARRNAVTGTVVLRAVFNSGGQVTNIRAIKGLPDGLTEKAILAARNIRFIPAMKEGRYVHQYIQIEYNFSLY
jgi:TonB family protein